MTWPIIWIAVAFAALAFCSAVLTKIILRILIHRAILDHPNERSSHTIPTPRGGGIAIVILCLIAWGITYYQDQPPLLYLPLIGAVILAGISWLDDLKPLSAKLRFSIQAVVVAISLPWITSVGSVSQGLLPAPLEIGLMAFVWLGFINFFNFMDGIDGISGVETIGIGGGLVLLWVFNTQALFPHPYLGLSLAASALGFLWFNWSPAQIFMGDIGSIFIGYLLGGLLLQTAASGHWPAAIILPLYYLADATLTLVKRAIRGEKIWQAHREHFYQFATQQGKSHRRISLAVALCNVSLIILAMVSLTNALEALLGAILSVTILLFWMSRKKPKEHLS